MSRTPTTPLISCMMVTQGGRFEMFCRAVTDFCKQTYRRRQLVIVSSDLAEAVAPYQAWLKSLDAPITWHHIASPTQLSIGHMRNVALDLSASAHFICSWDDDDRHHPERLAAHVAPLLTNDQLMATYMPVQMYWFVGPRELRIVDWRPSKTPGILMFRRTSRRYEPVSRHEDSRFFKALQLDGPVQPVVGKLDYYVRTIHDSNTSTQSHHLSIACQRSVSARQIFDHQGHIRAVVTRLGLGAGVKVCHRLRVLYTL